jgi:DNA/RNA-binding domain of Phe-tRNA-synthetase-like protein
MEIQVAEAVSKLGIDIMTTTMNGVSIGHSRKDVFDILVNEIKTEIMDDIHSLSNLQKDPRSRSYIDLFWKIGIDPTKTRPSSEALVRRLFRKGVPRINTMVDAGNLASARSMVPIGLYDINKLEEPLSLRFSKEGECFQGIGGKNSTLDEKTPVLSDDQGIIHIYPHRDCMRTRITEETEDVLVVACGARGIRDKNMEEAIELVKYYFDQLRG